MNFIVVTRSSGKKIRINFDLVLTYSPSPRPGPDVVVGVDTTMGTEIDSIHPDLSLWVRETADEIDRILNPTRTP
jgi:hypothetical protein